jgi:chromosome segregation ATPase
MNTPLEKDVLSLSKDLANIVNQIKEKNNELLDIKKQIELQKEELKKIRDKYQPLIDVLEKKLNDLREELKNQELVKNAELKKYEDELLRYKKNIEELQVRISLIKGEIAKKEELKNDLEEKIKYLYIEELQEIINIIIKKIKEIAREYEILNQREKNIEEFENLNKRMLELLQKGLGVSKEKQ